MIQIKNTLISEHVLEKEFVCDLNACKGACCVEGDAGAPLEIEESIQLEEIWEDVKPFLREEGVKAIEKDGYFTRDRDGELVTTLVEGKECAYAIFEEDGIAKCGIEKAHSNGAVNFKKPISCHLYPVRLSKVGKLDAVNYAKWHICEPACECGVKLQVPVYKFLKDALTRKFGQEWYEQLEEAANLLHKIKK